MKLPQSDRSLACHAMNEGTQNLNALNTETKATSQP